MKKEFKVGDEIIAITNPSNNYCQQREIGETYTVKHITYCTCCGTQMVNITDTNCNYKNGNCGCGTQYHTRGMFWTGSKHFIKREDASNISGYIQKPIDKNKLMALLTSTANEVTNLHQLKIK